MAAKKFQSEADRLESELLTPLEKFVFSLSQVAFFKSQSETFNLINSKILIARQKIQERQDQKDQIVMQELEMPIWNSDLEKLTELEFARREGAVQLEDALVDLQTIEEHLRGQRKGLGDLAISDMLASRQQQVDAMKKSFEACKTIEIEARKGIEYKIVSETEEEEIEALKEEIEALNEHKYNFKEYEEMIEGFMKRIEEFRIRESAFNTKESVEEEVKELAVDIVGFKDELDQTLKELHLTQKELEMKKISSGQVSMPVKLTQNLQLLKSKVGELQSLEDNVSELLAFIKQANEVYQKCEGSDLRAQFISLLQGTNKLQKQLADLASQLRNYIQQTTTLTDYLNAKEQNGEELTDEDAETMVTELENIEQFLIEQFCEISNLTRGWKVKEKRFKECLAEIKEEYIELRDAIVELIDFKGIFDHVIKSIRIGEQEMDSVEQVIQEFREHNLKEKFDLIEYTRENKEEKGLKEFLKAHYAALELKEVVKVERKKIFEAQILIRTVLEQELVVNLTDDWSIQLENGEELVMERFQFEAGNSSIGKAIKDKLDSQRGTLLRMKLDGTNLTFGQRRCEVREMDGIYVSVASGFMELEDFLRQFSVPELEKFKKKEAKMRAKEMKRVKVPELIF